MSTVSVIGDAPYDDGRAGVEKSVVSTPGVISRNWITAGTMNALVTPNSGIARRIAPGSTSRSSTVRQPWDSPTIDQPDARDVEHRHHGEVHRVGGEPPQVGDARRRPPKKLSLVSITPLGRPVVPDV